MFCPSVRGHSHPALHGRGAADRHLTPAGRRGESVPDRSGTCVTPTPAETPLDSVCCVCSVSTCLLQVSDSLRTTDSFLWQFRSLQLSLLLCSFVAVVGGAFFLATAMFIEGDRQRAENHVPAGETGRTAGSDKASTTRRVTLFSVGRRADRRPEERPVGHSVRVQRPDLRTGGRPVLAGARLTYCF